MAAQKQHRLREKEMNIDDITYAINKVYENALLVELKKRGLQAESQVPLKVIYKGETVGEYFADIVVEGKVLIELKVVDQLAKVHEAQLLNYLHATGMKVGLLVNFNGPRVEIKRFVA
jgi:GxxExxY protein